MNIIKPKRKIDLPNDYLIATLYFVVLEIIYYLIQANLFQYVGYKFNFDLTKFVLGWFIYLSGVVIVFHIKNNSVSTLFYYIFYFISFTPMVILYQFDSTKLWMILYHFFLMCFIILLTKCLNHIEHRDYSLLLNSQKLSVIIVIFISLFFAYSFLKNGIPSLSSMTFENIYITRSQASFSLIIIMLQSLVCKILIPIYFTYFFQERKWLLVAYLSMVQIYMYAITGFKTYLLMLGLIILLNIFSKLPLRRLIPLGLCGIMIVSFIGYQIIKNPMLPAVVFNRLLYLPARIKWAYLDFFTNHEFLFFSQSSIGSIFHIPNPYPTNIVYLIGDLYFNEPDMWTNTGFMVDAYANMGIVGGLIIGTMLSILLHWIDIVTYYDTKSVGTIMFILFFIALNDGGLISITFSGGLLVSIIVLAILKKRQGNNEA